MNDETKWLNPDLKARYEKNLADLKRRQREQPERYGASCLPFKVIEEWGVHGIQRMRLIWLKTNHPQELRELMMANVLEDHLQDIEDRTRARAAQIEDELMERRHLLNRTDIVQTHPEITDRDRLFGMKRAQADAMDMAIHEIVESF
ncbi:TnpV protein [Bifidobacterium tibiigranuli]|jgi:hypothetical protein|uniref:TnpV protein n=1 Tax=Bifidobacterium tibiigranuli TaxID=2172043 RepID=UPI002356A661|nr:TnpV protein [Bifidobacterium tibiigranuli]MCI1211156.1 TnpV protein [Bifidobacterium tibiigranuli]MCI1220334.1 TnpV protein [Bifidobacterium tibiigranuli]MCI1231983.1 TnpV protein [Bifidobacterium tibiigranuli]